MLACFFVATTMALAPGSSVSSRPAVTTATSPQLATELQMIEHEMPIMQPHLYEATLCEAMAEHGEVLRWYIARVKDDTAIAECVVLPSIDETDEKKTR